MAMVAHLKQSVKAAKMGHARLHKIQKYMASMIMEMSGSKKI